MVLISAPFVNKQAAILACIEGSDVFMLLDIGHYIVKQQSVGLSQLTAVSFLCQGLLQVGQQILDILDAYGEAQQRIGQAA